MPDESKTHSAPQIEELRKILGTKDIRTTVPRLDGLQGLAAHSLLDSLEEQYESLLSLAEHLFQMIDRQTWRDTGGDDGQGHYEGDYWAEQIEQKLIALRASNPAKEPKP